MMISLPCPAETLLPHRGPMLFLGRLDFASEDNARSTLEVKKDQLFSLPDGTLDTLAYVELLAQLTAACNSYVNLKNGRESGLMGYLVGLKNFFLLKSAAPGASLNLMVKKETQFENLSYVRGEISSDGAILARGSLKLWEAGISNKSGDAKLRTALANTDSGQTGESREKHSWLLTEIRRCLTKLTPAADGGTGRFFLPDDFVAFQGHFPGYPILPGVVMLKMAAVVAEMLAERSVPIREIKVAKFARTILPGAMIDIECKPAETRIDTTIREGSAVCAKMTFSTG